MYRYCTYQFIKCAEKILLYCTLVDLTYFNIGTGFQLKALLDRFLTALVGKGDSLENRTELHN